MASIQNILRSSCVFMDVSQGIEDERIAALREKLSEAKPIVLLHGNSELFCNGFNLEKITEESTDEELSRGSHGLVHFQELLNTLHHEDRTVVAVVEGPARGGGVGLAAVADLVIANKDASFALPEALFGLAPAVVLPFIANRIGLIRTQQLAFGAIAMNAIRAEQWGMVDILESQEPNFDLNRTLQKLLYLDSESIAVTKQLARSLQTECCSYDKAATEEFDRLSARTATSDRILRYMQGDTPWKSECEATT
ncbi:MAG: enoyl-CoA hydratase-related protein [Planctomycetota bacterium]